MEKNWKRGKKRATMKVTKRKKKKMWSKYWRCYFGSNFKWCRCRLRATIGDAIVRMHFICQLGIATTPWVLKRP